MPERLVAQAVDSYGSLDILVNNAGILRDKMSFNMEESDWDDVIRVHLKGHFSTAHHAAVYWRSRAKAGEDVSGRIINTCSESGLFGSAGQANYAAAKAGIVSMTWVLARELGRYGVTANAVAPRARTRMTETMSMDMNAQEGAFDAWHPRNIANVVGFLAAPESADISGQIFVVFGGNVHVMSAFKPVGAVDARRRVDAGGADRRQGRTVQGHRLGHPAVLGRLSHGPPIGPRSCRAYAALDPPGGTLAEPCPSVADRTVARRSRPAGAGSEAAEQRPGGGRAFAARDFRRVSPVRRRDAARTRALPMCRVRVARLLLRLIRREPAAPRPPPSPAAAGSIG